MRLEAAAHTHKGHIREQNQDAILAMQECGLFLVADGMGGEQAGDEASAQVVTTIKTAAEAFFKTPPAEPMQIEGMMRDTLLEASHDVLQIAVREPVKRGLGSTASLLCLHRGIYFIAQVGDSRIYLARDGRVRQLTRDHTLVWGLYEQGVITRAQLELHPERHLLTQCIGSQRPVQVDTFEGGIEPGDTFLICSDGLTGYVGEDLVFNILNDEGLNVDERAKRMVEEALNGGGGDNISVIVIRVAQLNGVDDDWEPGTTVPALAMGPSEETLANEPEYSARPNGHFRPRTLALLALLFICMMALSIPLFARSGQVKIYLRGAGPAPEKLEVLAAVEEQRIKRRAQQDEKGTYVLLPRGDKYALTLMASGYVSQHFELDLPAQAGEANIMTDEWVRQEQLPHGADSADKNMEIAGK